MPRKLNREEKKLLRGILVKLIKFIGTLSPDEITLVTRIFISKLSPTVDTDDDE